MTDQRLNMVMVPAADIARLRAFYEDGLGWTPWAPTSAMSVMYRTGTAVIVFLNAAYLAAESGIVTATGPRSIWALFVPTKAEVAPLFDRAVAAGATVTSPLRDRDGGLFSGYFTDPEGNGWEIVWSPSMGVGPDGGLTFGN